MVVSRHGHDAAGFSLHQTSNAACHPPSHSDSHHRVTSDLDAFEVSQSGTLCTADVGGLRAAGVESAACGRAQRVEHLALHRWPMKLKRSSGETCSGRIPWNQKSLSICLWASFKIFVSLRVIPQRDCSLSHMQMLLR
jgi:hypothetical protein